MTINVNVNEAQKFDIKRIGIYKGTFKGYFEPLFNRGVKNHKIRKLKDI